MENDILQENTNPEEQKPIVRRGRPKTPAAAKTTPKTVRKAAPKPDVTDAPQPSVPAAKRQPATRKTAVKPQSKLLPARRPVGRKPSVKKEMPSLPEDGMEIIHLPEVLSEEITPIQTNDFATVEIFSEDVRKLDKKNLKKLKKMNDKIKEKEKEKEKKSKDKQKEKEKEKKAAKKKKDKAKKEKAKKKLKEKKAKKKAADKKKKTKKKK